MSLYPSNPEIGEIFNNRQWSGTAWVALNNPLSVEYTTDGEFTGHTSASANVHGILNSASLVYVDELDNYLTQSSASTLYASSIDFNNHESASVNVHGIINSASVVYADDTKLSDERTPTNGSVTDAKIASGGLSASVISGTAVVDNDSRLSDARTPTDGSVTDAKIVSGGLSASVIANLPSPPPSAYKSYSFFVSGM
jgi:hypothetical protein